MGHPQNFFVYNSPPILAFMGECLFSFGQMLTGPTLLAEIERFLASGFCSETTFGVLAVHDGKLVKRLRNGKTVRLTTAERIIAFINKAEADKWPPRTPGRPATKQVSKVVKSYEA